MQLASTLVRTADLAAAVKTAAEDVRAKLAGAPSILFPFLRARDPNDYRRVPELLQAEFPDVPLFGCAAGGVIGDGMEEEGEPAFALTAASLPGATLRLLHLDPARITDDGLVDPRKLAAALALEPGAEPDALVLIDPFSVEPEPFIAAMDQLLPRSVTLGALAADGPVPRSTMLYGRAAHRRGALVLLIDGALRLRPLVAQGCRPIGRPHVVTAVEGNAVRELDQKPAIEALKTLHASLSEKDREIFRHSLFVGIEMDKGSVEVRTDRLLVRNLLGVDPDKGSIGVAAELKQYDVIHFVLRDSERATEELRTLLRAAHEDGAHPVGALLFSCLGRGRHLFGCVDHDPDLFRDEFGDLPVGGFFANGEIAPVGGRTFLHGYTSAFALFEPRPPR